MDEYTRTLYAAIDAGVRGDRQAIYMAQWLLADLRSRVELRPHPGLLGAPRQTGSSAAAILD